MYAHSEFPPFHRVFVLQLIAQISSQNILLMIILRTHILIILIFSGFIGQIIFTITFTSTKNILYTSFNAVYRIYRIGIVQLSRMLLCAGIILKYWFAKDKEHSTYPHNPYSLHCYWGNG